MVRQKYRTTFQLILAIAAFVLILVLSVEFIMPLPGAVVLSVGSVASVVLFFFRSPKFGAGTALLTLATATWLVQPVVSIRPATGTDPVFDRYFGINYHADLGIDSTSAKDAVEFRTIAVAKGVFNPKSRLNVRLCNVKKGEIRELNLLSVCRSGSRDGPFWEKSTYILAFGEQKFLGGRSTQIGIVGHSRGSGQHGDPRHNVSAKTVKSLPARLTPGEARIIYVEGDDGFAVDPSMSLPDFAILNQGNYLVVEVEFE
jgi:hypothetical protein